MRQTLLKLTETCSEGEVCETAGVYPIQVLPQWKGNSPLPLVCEKKKDPDPSSFLFTPI